MKALEYIKAHPAQSGVFGVVGIIVVYAIFSRLGGGASSGASSTQPSDAQIQAAASIQAAQIQSQAAMAAGNNDLAIAQMNIDAQKQANNLQAAEQINSDTLAAQIAHDNITAQTSIAQAQIDSANKQASIAAGANIVGQYLNTYALVESAAINNPITTTTQTGGTHILGLSFGSKSNTTVTAQNPTLPDLSAFLQLAQTAVGSGTTPAPNTGQV